MTDRHDRAFQSQEEIKILRLQLKRADNELVKADEEARRRKPRNTNGALSRAAKIMRETARNTKKARM